MNIGRHPQQHGQLHHMRGVRCFPTLDASTRLLKGNKPLTAIAASVQMLEQSVWYIVIMVLFLVVGVGSEALLVHTRRPLYHQRRSEREPGLRRNARINRRRRKTPVWRWQVFRSKVVTSLPVSRDCPVERRFFSLAFSHRAST
jgi:hypothetical protein